MVTASRLRYQDFRGLTRSFSLVFPVSKSHVHTTSLAVKGLPSCHRTLWRNGNVRSVPSSFHDQPVARSGPIESRLFCFTCWSNMSRLLNTPIIGPSATNVASSWIDMLAGLSGLYIFKMPPGFWAEAGAPAATTRSNGAAIAHAPRYRIISVHLTFPVPRPIVRALNADYPRYWSSQRSSMRQPLKGLLAIRVSPWT